MSNWSVSSECELPMASGKYFLNLRYPFDWYLIVFSRKLALAAMKKLRVLRMYQCTFVKYDEKTHRLLKTAEPYITWGKPDVRTIRELLSKRGYAEVDVSMNYPVS